MEEKKEKCPLNNGHTLVVLHLDKDNNIIHSKNSIVDSSNHILYATTIDESRFILDYNDSKNIMLFTVGSIKDTS